MLVALVIAMALTVGAGASTVTLAIDSLEMLPEASITYN
jgi:hypothetical protein